MTPWDLIQNGVLHTNGLFLFLFGLTAIWVASSYTRLRRIPGPFFASLTNIPRLLWVRNGDAHDTHVTLHRKYGRLVRFGPNMISVSDPAEIPNIYSFSGKFPKSDFYRALSFYVKGKAIPGLFATQDENIHRLLKRPIAGMYSMTSLVSYEPHVDSTIRAFFNELDIRFVRTGEVCNLHDWLQMFAFDVIGEITFSKRFGFLEQGKDIEGIMGSSWRYFSNASLISQMPWLDYIWVKNPILQRLRKAKINPIVAFARTRRAEHEKEVANSFDIADENAEANKNRDFLTRFMEVERKDSATPAWAVNAWATSNITAGSDTTAILLRTVLYNLIKHPSSLAALRRELSSHGIDEHAVVTWKRATNLPYLDAIIKEAGRMHPPFGLPYERVVPAGGAMICGEQIPPGTVVGISAWVVHRDYEIFGKDSDVWRPERWTEASEEVRRKMEGALLTFGAGHRSCIGKNISYLEIYKLVPTMVGKYDVSLKYFTQISSLRGNTLVANKVHFEGLRSNLQMVSEMTGKSTTNGSPNRQG